MKGGFLLKIVRILAFLEGLSLILLLGMAMPIKYALGDPSYVKIIGMAHGWLFVAFIGFVFYSRSVLGYSTRVMFILMLSSLLPFGTFYTDYKYLRSLSENQVR